MERNHLHFVVWRSLIDGLSPQTNLKNDGEEPCKMQADYSNKKAGHKAGQMEHRKQLLQNMNSSHNLCVTYEFNDLY